LVYRVKEILHSNKGESLIESILSIMILAIMLVAITTVIMTSLNITTRTVIMASDFQRDLNEVVLSNYDFADDEGNVVSDPIAANITFEFIITDPAANYVPSGTTDPVGVWLNTVRGIIAFGP
jgi:hypothetical protein